MTTDIADMQRLVVRRVSTFLVAETRRLMVRHGASYGRAVVHLAISVDSMGRADRAVSSHSIAQSLSLSTETVRRHGIGLVRDGLCERTDAGFFFTPRRALLDEVKRDDVTLMIVEAKALFAELAVKAAPLIDMDRIEPDQRLKDLLADAPADAGPRWVYKLSIERFFLRLWEFGIAAHGDGVDLALYMALIALNTKTIADDARSEQRYAGRATPPPDALITPASAAEISAASGFPDETVRRRLDGLIAKGRCARVGPRYVFTRAFMETPVILQAGVMTTKRTIELMQSLRAFDALNLAALTG